MSIQLSEGGEWYLIAYNSKEIPTLKELCWGHPWSLFVEVRRAKIRLCAIGCAYVIGPESARLKDITKISMIIDNNVWIYSESDFSAYFHRTRSALF